MFVNNYISTVILLAIGVQSIDLEGQPCYHVTKNLTGTCTLLVNCASVFQEVQKQVPPQVCGLSVTAPIVCCPKIPVGYKSRQKCLEYSKLRKGKCNIEFDRSVKLTDAVGKEFPYMAILGYSGSNFMGRRYICGGTLISERFVLIAANCAVTKQNDQLRYVRLGELHLLDNEDDAEPQEYKIEQIVFHPNYRPNNRYDIALVKLDRDVEFTAYVFPTCLHVGREFDSSGRLLIVGWGISYLDSDDRHQQMRRILLKVIQNEQCKKELMYQILLKYNELTGSIVDDMMICAESDQPVCYADLSSSLQTLRRDVDCMYDMVGMHTFINVCGFTPYPDAYLRISHYIKWIEKVVWP